MVLSNFKCKTIDDPCDLNIYSLLALKFVSKTINAKTKTAKGDAIVDARGMRAALFNSELRLRALRASKSCYTGQVCLLEARGFFRRRLRTLTCSRCGRLKRNSVAEFGNESCSERNTSYRACLTCRAHLGLWNISWP